MPNIEQNFRLNWASFGSGDKRQDDSADFTVFVGDLAADVTDYTLQDTFKVHCTSVKGAKVVTDRTTGRSKGYGFVRFADEGEQLRAMTEMNGQFCSTRPMRIGSASNKKTIGVGQQQYPKGCLQALMFRGLKVISAEMHSSLTESLKLLALAVLDDALHTLSVSHQSVVRSATYQSTPDGTQNEIHPNNTTIFVGGLGYSVTEAYLRQVFSQFGELSHVKIPVGKRCGFVQFDNRTCAE
ncbi:polyadenylate-binding protein RBP45A-like [Papaver somniferum]|uniref:polyadenylate-binding protein RBP45A-like n=1 Tax=Papaver somniferum TaxID=3469 RepID=UPI000E6FF507|nr:polyadenylate-binding protein RBP45A-like [Papaver somniferum]